MNACRERARPIIMTTMAMAAGMLPTALGLGQGSEFRQPMAIAVIGGLISSTALSLVLVPVVYEFVDQFEKWITPKFSRLVTPKSAGRRRALRGGGDPGHHHRKRAGRGGADNSSPARRARTRGRERSVRSIRHG